MVASEAGWKIFGSSSFVINSVFEGGEGCDNGGIEDRSRDMGDCARFAERVAGEDEAEGGGDSVEVESAGGGLDKSSAMMGGCVEVQAVVLMRRCSVSTWAMEQSSDEGEDKCS